jgi:hypothetical protein
MVIHSLVAVAQYLSPIMLFKNKKKKNKIKTEFFVVLSIRS